MVGRVEPTSERAPASTPELARQAAEDVGELVRREIQLARDEMRRDVGRATVPAALAAAGAVLAWAGTGLCVTATAVLHPRGVRAAGAALALLGLAAIAVGWRMLPKRPLSETRERLKTDERLVREQLQVEASPR